MWKIWKPQICMFIGMLCIFCLSSSFTWMSNIHQPESPWNLYHLQACPAQDSVLAVARSFSHSFSPTPAKSISSFCWFFLQNPLKSKHFSQLCHSCSKPQLLLGYHRAPLLCPLCGPDPLRSILWKQPGMCVSGIWEMQGSIFLLPQTTRK